jgi:replicative DNA helicase
VLNSRNQLDSLYAIFRGMIRQEIDQTPGFRELTGRSELPANAEAEKAVLGAMMLDNTVNLAEVDADNFSLDSHRRIWLAMGALMEAGKPVDFITLQEQMGDGVKEIGGVAYLASLTEGLPRLPRVSEYIAIVQEKAKLRRIMQACTEAIKACQEQRQSASEIVGQLGVALKGIKRGNGK